MNGEAIVLYDFDVTVSPGADGGFVVEQGRAANPEGFAEAIDSARKRGDAASMAEARKLEAMGPYVMDISTNIRIHLELDADGVVRRGTHQTIYSKPAGEMRRETYTMELVQPDEPAAMPEVTGPSAAAS